MEFNRAMPGAEGGYIVQYVRKSLRNAMPLPRMWLVACSMHVGRWGGERGGGLWARRTAHRGRREVMVGEHIVLHKNNLQ